MLRKLLGRAKKTKPESPPEQVVPEGPRHVILPANMVGRDFLLGDLHGCLGAFVMALKDVKFDESKDRIISVGDLVDRGPQSYDCLKLVRAPWFHAVRGNHEAMLLKSDDPKTRTLWRRNGGEWFFDLEEKDQMTCFKLAASLPLAITLKHKSGATLGICHAEWPGDDWSKIEYAFDVPWASEQMIWGRTVLTEGAPRSDRSASLTVHGHTPIDHSLRLGSALFIDTGCVYGGLLTLISAEDALGWPQKPDDEPITLR